MVAGLALTSFQPTNEEQELFSSGSPHEDAVLALKLIRTAPDASVDSMLKDLSSSGKSEKAFQMLASALVSIQVAPELAETGKLCPKKDIIILKFNQLLERLVSRVAAHNASDLAAYEEQQKAVQDWLDVESTYRSASEKAAKAKEGASFAEAQYEQWNAALTATKERQEKEIKDNIAVKAGNDAERELIKELLGLIDELQSEDSSTDKQAVLQQFRQKLSELKEKAGSRAGLKFAQIQKLTTTQLIDAPEADEVKIILRQMLDDLDDQDATMVQSEAKTAQEVADDQAKVTEYATSLVTLSNEADRDTQAADTADLQREAAAGVKNSAVQAYTDKHAAWLLAGPRYDRQIAIIKLIMTKVQAHCSGGTGSMQSLGCPPGSSGTLGDCIPCPANSFCEGGSHVQACPPLTESPASSTSADACACLAGYYNTGSSCTVCPPGSYCTGGTAIASCPDKSTSPEGSTQVAECSCQPGYYGESATDCAVCHKNKICKGGNVVDSCPAHSQALEGSADISACVCAAGYHGANGAECLPCTAGSYCGGGNSIAKCPDNTISSSTSKSITDCSCHPGYYGTGSTCTYCPEGSYCAGGTSINACPPNSNSPAGSSQLSQCVCGAGYFGHSESCTECPENHVCQGGASAVSCPANSASPKGSTDITQCVCNPGFAGNNGDVCVPCALDSYCVGGSETQKCPALTKAPAGSKSFSECTCPIEARYTPKGSSSGYPPVEGGPACEQYGTQDVGSTCEARSLCDGDASCRGFIFTKGPEYTPAQPQGKAVLFKGPANCLGSIQVTGDSEFYLRNNQPPDVWKMKVYQAPSDISRVPLSMGGFKKFGATVVPTVDIKTVAGFKSLIPSIPDTYFVWVFTGTLTVVTPGRYYLCTMSDDGSNLYIDNIKVVDNDGLHGDKQVCSERDLVAGQYRMNAVGFNAGSGASMQVTYKGPDTGGVEKPMLSSMRRNSDQLSSGDADYLDGDQEPESAGWKMKTYQGPSDMSKVPASLAGFRRFGAIVVQTVNVKSLAEFRSLIPGTPDKTFVWVFAGTLTVATPGTYKLCTRSDDGSNLYIDDVKVVDNDGFHSEKQVCSDKDLAAGQYRVNAVGFQGSVDASMQVTYKGPDTGDVEKLMPSSMSRNSKQWSNGV